MSQACEGLGTSLVDGTSRSMAGKTKIDDGQIVFIFVWTSVYSSELRTSIMTKNHGQYRNMTEYNFILKCIMSKSPFVSCPQIFILNHVSEQKDILSHLLTHISYTNVANHVYL